MCVTFQKLGSIVSNFLECPVSEALFEFHANIPGATKVSRKKSDAKRHYLNVHKGRKYSCPRCNKLFSSREMVKAHCQNVHEKNVGLAHSVKKVFRWHCNF